MKNVTLSLEIIKRSVNYFAHLNKRQLKNQKKIVEIKPFFFLEIVSFQII